MTTESIPRPLIVLREEFQPMAESLNSRMLKQPRPSSRKFDIFDLTGDHIQKLSNHVRLFGEQIRGIGTIAYEPDEHFRRIARHLKKELNGMLDGYDDVRSRTPYEDVFEAWKLLVEIYEDTLHQIQDWLTDMLKFLNDPISEAETRKKSVDGTSLVRLDLELNAPEQMLDLQHWMERRIEEQTFLNRGDALTQKQNRARVGSAELIMGILIAAMTGWG